MKQILKIFTCIIAVGIFYYAFIFVFFYDNIQYKQIGNTNFYLLPNDHGEGAFLYHDGGEDGTFYPINHKGIVRDVYWNQQFVIIKCSQQRDENWSIIRNLKDYNYSKFNIQYFTNESDYHRALDSLKIYGIKMEHTDGSIPWSLHL